MQDENKGKLQDLLNEIDIQKKKTGFFTPPTEQQIEEYRQKQLEAAQQRAAAQPARQPEQAAESKPAEKAEPQPLYSVQLRPIDKELVESSGETVREIETKATRAGLEAGDELPNRSFKELLKPSKEDEEKEVGRMLAPTIPRGFEAEDHAEHTEPAPAEQKEQADHSSHPLFTTSHSVEIERIRREALEKETREAAMAARATAAGGEQGELLIDEEAKRHSAEGLLNVRGKVNDEFREFFGDTIIIDRDPSTSRRTKQRRIKDFVPATETEQAHIVFEDDEPKPVVENDIEEYCSDEDTEPVMTDLLKRKAKSLLIMILTAVAALAMLALNIAALYGLPFAAEIKESEIAFTGINTALAALLFGLHAKRIVFGFGKMITLKADASSIYALPAFVMLAEPAVFYFLKVERDCYIAAPIAALALMFAAIGEYISIRGVLLNFKQVSSGNERHVSFVPEDEVNSRLAKRANIDQPELLLKRKTGFSDNFIQNSFSHDSQSNMLRIIPFVIFIASLIAGGIGYYRERTIVAAFGAFALTAAVSGSLCSTLKSVLPLNKMQKSLARFGVVMPGYAAAERVAGINGVLLDGREIFPKGCVLLHGIKTFEREQIDRAILYAASVIIPSCETLAPVFLNVIQGKTDMLYKTESIASEDGLGFSAWADGHRVLIGNREMMAAHEIEIPSLDYELRYTKTRSRDAIYLAVNGRLFALFVVSYTLGREAEESIKKYEQEGIAVLVRTNDFNITSQKISEIFSIPQSVVTVLRKPENEYVSDIVSYKAHSESLFNHIGSLGSYTAGIMACHKLVGSAKASNSAVLISMLLGALISLALVALGSLSQVTLTVVLLYHALWALIVAVISSFSKY